MADNTTQNTRTLQDMEPYVGVELQGQGALCYWRDSCNNVSWCDRSGTPGVVRNQALGELSYILHAPVWKVLGHVRIAFTPEP